MLKELMLIDINNDRRKEEQMMDVDVTDKSTDVDVTDKRPSKFITNS